MRSWWSLRAPLLSASSRPLRPLRQRSKVTRAYFPSSSPRESALTNPATNPLVRARSSHKMRTFAASSRSVAMRAQAIKQRRRTRVERAAPIFIRFAGDSGKVVPGFPSTMANALRRPSQLRRRIRVDRLPRTRRESVFIAASFSLQCRGPGGASRISSSLPVTAAFSVGEIGRGIDGGVDTVEPFRPARVPFRRKSRFSKFGPAVGEHRRCPGGQRVGQKWGFPTTPRPERATKSALSSGIVRRVPDTCRRSSG